MSGFRCLLCGDTAAPRLVQNEVKGDESGRLKAVQCRACAHVQLSPPAYSLDFYEGDGQVRGVVAGYGTPQETVFAHSEIEARRRVERFAALGQRFDDAGMRLLDVGGGYGFFGAAMAQRHPGVATTVLEPSAARAETGRRCLADRGAPLPALKTGLLDEAFAAANAGRFDIVTLWHVLEHVEDPATLLRLAGKVLRPGTGSLWVEVPNLDDELAALSPAYRRRSFMREHISYFSAAVLERTARQVFPDAAIEVLGYQRYGIFNYFHWIHFNAPQGAAPDMFGGRDRWWLEAAWRTAREQARTSDALLLIVRPGAAAAELGEAA
jgi:2-polyprenyl-3-methyl-5-hydroxy-6-metoxy-1,4-benzoquinol methylase